MSTSTVYEQYFGLEEHPFSITPDPRFVYLSDSHRKALEHLQRGAMGGANGFVLLSGDVGAGKTTLCRSFLEQVPPKTEVALILNPVLTLNEFLQTICDELDLVIDGSRESNKNLIDHLNRFLLQVYAVGQKTILIVDEAQNLTHELLEQIRLLTNLETNTDKLLQIFLIGQPELRDMLDRPDMLQVSQRITSRYHLGPLSKSETREYILKRLEVAGTNSIEFTAGALRRIFAFSKGVPRLINVLCDKALLSAYENSTSKINASVVRDAEQRVRGNLYPVRGGRWKSAAGFGAAVGLVGLVLGGAYWANVTGMRSWFVDKGQPEVVAVEPTGSVPRDAPPSRPSTAQMLPMPDGKGARTSVDAGTAMPLERAVPGAHTGASADLGVSSDRVESVDGAVWPSPQTDVAQVSATGGKGRSSRQESANTPAAEQGLTDTAIADSLTRTENVASVDTDQTTAAENLVESPESDVAAGSPGVEEAQMEHVAGMEAQSGSTQADAAGVGLESRVSRVVERAPDAHGQAGSASGVPLARVTKSEIADSAEEKLATRTEMFASEPATTLAEGAAGPAREEIRYGPPVQERADPVQGEMVARVDNVESTSSNAQRSEKSKPKAGSTSVRAPAAPDSRTARPPVQTLTGYTKKYAERELLSMWGVKNERPADIDLCGFARRNGLNCLNDGRGLAKLYVFNRPAIIAIKVDDLDSYALVTKASPDNVVLNVLGRKHVISANVLPNVWDGRFLVLWRGPSGINGNLVQGATGQPVVQLRKIIDRIQGKNTIGDVYDAELVARVKQFQSNVGLTPDGIVGPRTQIVMQNKLAEIEKK